MSPVPRYFELRDHVAPGPLHRYAVPYSVVAQRGGRVVNEPRIARLLPAAVRDDRLPGRIVPGERRLVEVTDRLLASALGQSAFFVEVDPPVELQPRARRGTTNGAGDGEKED